MFGVLLARMYSKDMTASQHGQYSHQFLNFAGVSIPHVRPAKSTSAAQDSNATPAIISIASPTRQHGIKMKHVSSTMIGNKLQDLMMRRLRNGKQPKLRYALFVVLLLIRTAAVITWTVRAVNMCLVGMMLKNMRRENLFSV